VKNHNYGYGPLLSVSDVQEILRLPSLGAARKYIQRDVPKEFLRRIGRRVRVVTADFLRHVGLDQEPGGRR